MLPLNVPIVAGVIQVTSLSTHRVTLSTGMPVVSAKAEEAFKDLAKGLNVKPKNSKDADNGGDGQGKYIQARVSAGTKRKQGDSDDSDADPLDAVWGGPILSSRSSGS